MTEVIKTNVKPTAEEIAAWEAQYGKLRQIEVNRENEQGVIETLIFCFKKNYPNKKMLVGTAQKALLDKDLMKYNEIIIKNSVVNGLDVIELDFEVFMSLTSHVDKIISESVATLVKQ